MAALPVLIGISQTSLRELLQNGSVSIYIQVDVGVILGNRCEKQGRSVL
jgi:hypothetical protein